MLHGQMSRGGVRIPVSSGSPVDAISQVTVMGAGPGEIGSVLIQINQRAVSYQSVTCCCPRLFLRVRLEIAAARAAAPPTDCAGRLDAK